MVFLVLVAGGTYFFSGSSAEEIRMMRWGLLFYFTVLTLLFHLGLEMASKGKAQAFIRFYMGATSFKLMIHLGVILVFAFSYKTLAVPFIVSFIVFYFLFTAFEVGMNWQRFRR